jgi:hypothetical protein
MGFGMGSIMGNFSNGMLCPRLEWGIGDIWLRGNGKLGGLSRKLEELFKEGKMSDQSWSGSAVLSVSIQKWRPTGLMLREM